MPRCRQSPLPKSAEQLNDLMSSAKRGNPEAIRHKATQMGRDVNGVFVGGKTLLAKAIEDNEALSTVEAIIKAGADVNSPNSQGKTALMMAVKARRPELLQVLIQYGANPQLETAKCMSAISLCLKRKHYSCLEILLRQNIDKNDSICEHLQEICLFIRRTNKSNVTNKCDLGCSNMIVDTRLISAIKNVYDVNIKDNNGNTPLMHAVRCHYDDCVRLLLMAGADVNKINKSKETALTIAMTRSHNPILKDLIRAGALRRHPRGKISNLHFGMFKMILDYLQQNGLFYMTDIYGKTALMYAAQRGDKECIVYAVEMDIEEFVKAKFLRREKETSAPRVDDRYDGDFVLSLCPANGRERNCNDSIDKLLEDKRKYQDNNGRPIILYAFETGQMLLGSYIQSRMFGNLEYRDGNGRTILMNFFKFYKQNKLCLVTQHILNMALKKKPECKSSIMSAFQLTYKTVEGLFCGKANIRDNSGDSTVIYALRYCDFLTEEITKLLVGDTHKEQYQDGKTALMMAVIGYNGGCHKYIEPLIGDSCSIQDNDGKTALMYALSNKFLPDDLLKEMVGDSQNVQDEDGKTALMYAFIRKRKLSGEMIELLAGETPYSQDNAGKTALMYAFEYKLPLTSSSIQKIFGGQVDISDKEGNTTLIYALKSELSLGQEIVPLLVGDRAAEKCHNGKTALMIALDIYNTKYPKYDYYYDLYFDTSNYILVNYLKLLAGESCRIQDEHGNTALMHALKNSVGIPENILQLMIGDSQDIQDENGKTALMYAFEYKGGISESILQMMIGDSKNVQDQTGKTALMFAFIHKKKISEEIIELLAGENPFIQDNNGKTALMYAFEYNHDLTCSCIHKLYDGKVDVCDIEGYTTLIYALKYNLNLTEEKITLLFVDKPIETHQNGQTALMIALQFYKTNLQKYDHYYHRHILSPEYIAGHYLKQLVGDSCRVQDNEGKTALMYALINFKVISEYILQMMIGDSQIIQDNEGKTALMYTFIYGHKLSEEIIELLAGENPFIQDNGGKTALMYAFEYQQDLTYSSIQKLFAEKFDIRDNEGNTTLIYWLKYGVNPTEQITSLFFGDRKAEKYENGQTALMIALNLYNKYLKKYDHNYSSFLHRLEYIEGQILKPLIGEECSAQDFDGKTALMYALIKTKRLSENILRMMIGDSQNIQDCEGKTALMYAFIYKYKLSEEMIELLAGDNPFIQDNTGKTALMYAFKRQKNLTHTSIQKLFGGRVEICDNEGKTHLIYCLEFYSYINEEIAKLLVGDTHKAQYQHGKTALMIALENNKNLDSIQQFIQSLIDCSCDVQDSNGQTALMCAIKHNCRLPEHLIEQMITETQFIQDKDGKTALMYASQISRFYNTWIIKLFHKDAINLQDNEGKTALHHAIEHNKTNDFIQELILSGSNLEVEDKQKRTALVWGIQSDTSDTKYISQWSDNFTKTKMLLRYNPMPKLNLLGKKCLLKSIHRGMFRLKYVWRDKEIFRLLIINGIEPFPHVRDKMSMFFAVLNENLIDVVKYLIANMYLTYEGLMLLIKAKNYLKSDEYRRNKRMLINGTYLNLSSPDLKHLITDVTSQPWPLVKLSFLVVSSAVGHGKKRKFRVNRLPLPNPIKDCLMFNTRTALIPVSEWSNIPMVFDPVEYEKTRRPRPLLKYWPFGAELVV